MKGHRIPMAYEIEMHTARPTSNEATPLLEQQLDEVSKTAETDDTILGEEALSSIEHKLESVKEEFREIVRNGLESEITSLDEWLRFRVKNELVAQIFTAAKLAEHDEHTINISNVKDVIEEEMYTQKANAEQSSQHIDEIIPVAKGRFLADTRASHMYVNSDVDNLIVRQSIKNLAKDFIKELQNTCDDGLFELSEQYIGQTIEAAKTEVIDHLAHRNNQLEEELADRDMQILNLEAESHLASDAHEFAK
jgi:ribosomal protein L17